MGWLCSGEFFWDVQTLAAMHTLSMLDCQSLTDAGLTAVAKLPALQTLTLDECELLTDQGKDTSLASRLGLGIHAASVFLSMHSVVVHHLLPVLMPV